MYKRIYWIGVLAFVPVTAPCLSAVSRPVGQLLNVAGTVEVQHAGQPWKRASLLTQLRENDVLQVRSGGSADVVLFQNGARFMLSGASTVRVAPTELKLGSGSAPKPLARLGPDFVRRLNTPARQISPEILGVLVRATEDPVLGPRHPWPNGAVRAEPVTLRWSGPIEGQQLQLVIGDGVHTIRQVNLPPTARSFRVPKGILGPGQEYVWSITAMRGGESSPQCSARLRVLPAAEAKEVARLERETAAARASAPGSPGYLLLLAENYERLGLIDDARAAYEKVLRLRPDDPGVQAALHHLTRAETEDENR